MTLEEIFTQLANHMRAGIAFHHDLSNAFNFLGLYGYGKCHEYHYFEEQQNYMDLLHYYEFHFHFLIHIQENEKTSIIPETWYKYTTMAIDANTKRTATQEFMKKWIEWERKTKKLYQDMYKELCEIGEIAAANKVKYYICDVDEELKHAEKKFIKLETTNYDIVSIIDQQQPLYNKFKKELTHLFK